jgi:hypothetical protein
MYAIAITENGNIVGYISGENDTKAPKVDPIGRYHRRDSAEIAMERMKRETRPWMNIDPRYKMRIVEI